MANSKDGSAKPRKIVDVAAPGKAAPPATSRPIIVTNRPMIKRDPMMAPGEAAAAPEEPTPSISRAPRPLRVIPTSPAVTTTPETQPTSNEAVQSIDSTPVAPADVQSDSKSEAGVVPIAVKHDEQEVALDIGSEVLRTLGENPADNPAPTPPQEAVAVEVPTEEVSSDNSAAEEQAPVSAEESAAVTPIIPEPAAEAVKPVEAEPAAATPAPTATPPAEPETEPEPQQVVEDESDLDEQLPASQVLEEDQKKKDEAAAQLLAEQEKIIASKRFYLPIKSRSRRRGIVRAVIALALVIFLSLVWLDVVLDAGIVHISGLHPLTSLFK